MKNHVTKGSVLDDLNLSKEEAQNLKIRAVLMRELEHQIKLNQWTQKEAAQKLNVSQPRISNLIKGKIELFTIDMLVNMLTKCGVPVSLIIDDRIAA